MFCIPTNDINFAAIRRIKIAIFTFDSDGRYLTDYTSACCQSLQHKTGRWRVLPIKSIKITDEFSKAKQSCREEVRMLIFCVHNINMEYFYTGMLYLYNGLFQKR